MFIVVIVDGTELEGVRSQNFGGISIRRVVGVVVVTGAKGRDIRGKTRRPYDAGNATEEILEGQRVADSRLTSGDCEKFSAPITWLRIAP